MKRILILVVPLVLFAGFLFIKPPAVGVNSNPAGVTNPPVSQLPTPSNSGQPQSPNVNNTPGPSAKPTISGGYDDDDEEDGGDKPRYGGHGDDDYDD
jgi:hypothetical protein